MRSKAAAHRAADRQRSVIAQQHVVLVAEVLLQPRAPRHIERDNLR